MRHSPTMILEGIMSRNTFDSTTADIRLSSMLSVFGSKVSLLKISCISTPTDPGLERKIFDINVTHVKVPKLLKFRFDCACSYVFGF